MKVFIPAYFITSGHSVQKWKGTDMESMRDTKRIMEREIKKGSTPLSFEQMEIDTNNYHLEYVIGCMKETTTKITNIKAYMITALYNAPTTINHFYQQEVQHDMYGGGWHEKGII